MDNKKYKSIRYFVQNKVIAHLLFIIIIVIGYIGITNIRTQLIPNLSIPSIYTLFSWPGASAEQMEADIIKPAENSIQDIEGLNEITSVSRIGSATVALSFEQEQDLGLARQETLQELDQTKFPDGMEEIKINIIDPKEQVARILITDETPEALHRSISTIRQSLSQAGIESTSVAGDPEPELVLTVNPNWLIEQKIDMSTLASIVKEMLKESPTGFIGEEGQYTSTEVGIPFEQVINLQWSIKIPNNPIPQKASDIFNHAKEHASESSARLFKNDINSAEIRVYRPDNQDLLITAATLQEWFDAQQNANLSIFDETWSYFYDRLTLLGKNGIAGLLLIGLLLSYFLSAREAFWVGMGLPISILGTVAVMYLLNFHISMISLFAMILSLGIIVDDAIVVAERFTSLRRWMNGPTAAVLAASQMVKPIATSSLTTLAAFFPLLFLSGVSGQFLREIPIVVITVIVASLLECFYILPKHLSSIKHLKQHISKPQKQFRYFRKTYFFPMIRASIDQKPIIIASALSFVFITFALISTGRIQFSFFPSFTSDRIVLQVDFAEKATFDEKKQYLLALEEYSTNTINNMDKDILKQHYIVMNQTLSDRTQPNPITNGLQIWLIDQDKRKIDNLAIVNQLKQNPPTSNLVDNLIIDQPRGGPPSDVLQLELTGPDDALKPAIDELKERISQYQGTYNVQDDVAAPIPNYYFSIKDTTLFSNIDTQALSLDLRSYLQDHKAFTLNHLGEEVGVIIMLPEYTRNLQADLFNIPINMPNGAMVPLSSITNISNTLQPQALIRKNLSRTYTVSSNIDSTQTNTYQIEANLYKNDIPEIEKDYKVTISSGKIKQNQLITINELKSGAIIGCCLIFLILVWATNSFKLPIAILLTLPLSLTGGILGHWFLGFDITLLSLFGFFGLMGVTVNDSIILTLQYQHLKKSIPGVQAIKQASCDRFRAVTLTSLTTVGGLLPLMFETSFQAQFLIPMAITIAFGLLFGTLWILLFLPAILSIIDQ